MRDFLPSFLKILIDVLMKDLIMKNIRGENVLFQFLF